MEILVFEESLFNDALPPKVSKSLYLNKVFSNFQACNAITHLVPLLPVNGNSFLSIFERSAMNRRCCRGGEKMQLMRKDDDGDDDLYIIGAVCHEK